MASTYSTNLAIELIGTGDQAGAWGNTTNTNLGTLIEQAISGYVTQAVSTGTDTTITIPNGATGVARNMYIELTGTGGASTNLIVPANKKLYFIFNNSTGAVTVKVSGQTGVSVPQGKKVVLTSNGTDIVNGLNYIADFGSNSATITQLTATSATITNLTLTSLVISNLSIASANITTLTSASATITNLITTNDAVIDGVSVGQGAGNVATNTRVGATALALNTTGSRNTAIGYFSLLKNTTGANNTGVGIVSLYENTTGSSNVAIGDAALTNNSSGANNTAVGNNALGSNTTASGNTAVGYQALYTNSNAGCGTAVGYQAGYSANSGSGGVHAFGYQAMANTTSGDGSAFGYQALLCYTTGTQNSAFGFCASRATTTGGYNSSFGVLALAANTTGASNTAIGVCALQANTTSSCNTAVGFQAAYNVTTGTGRGTFLGYNAGFCNTTGTDNIAIGYLAGYFNQTGNANVFIGSGLYGVDNPAGYATTSSRNTFVGWAAGTEITSGGCNTIIGGYGGNQDSLDIRTSSNYVVLSTGTGTRQLSMYEGGTVALDNAVPVAGTGITFPATQSASSNANTLDDYEEGTWTPVIKGGSTEGTATYANQSGTYVKIGRLVYIQCYLTWSSATGTGTMQIGNLPFNATSAPTAYTGISIGYWSNIAIGAGAFPSIHPVPGSNSLYLGETASGGGAWTNISVDAAGDIIIGGCYVV